MSFHRNTALWLLSLASSMIAIPIARGGDPDMQAFRIHHGTGNLSLFGFSAASLRDVDGDGVRDYAVGSAGASFFTGKATVFSGSSGEVIDEYFGHSIVSFFGGAIADAGDVDGDGFPDVVIGAPVEFEGVDPVGAVYVFSGRTGQQLRHIMGSQTASAFGWSVAGVGDINGDGRADFAVGAPFYLSQSGKRGLVTVFSGAGGVLLDVHGTESQSSFGISIAALGDVNGDGQPDLAVGAPGSRTVSILNLQYGTIVRTLTNTNPGSGFGAAVGNAGDTNQDGVNDLVVGAPNYTSGSAIIGRAYLYNGATGAVRKIIQGTPGSAIGSSVGGAGDFDHDGYSDFLVGSPNYGAGSHGRAAVYSGRDGAILHMLVGGSASKNLGSAVTGIGDINGDGFDDILVGDSDHAPEMAGTAYVMTGASNEFNFEFGLPHALIGTNPLQILGAPLNSDDLPELLLLCSNRLVLGVSQSASSFAPVGFNIANGTKGMAAGDLNFDGRIDVAVCTANDRSVSFYRNQGAGLVFDSRRTFTGTLNGIVAARFNADARTDLAALFAGQKKVRIMLNAPLYGGLANQVITDNQTLTVGNGAVQILAARLNSDMRPDLVVVNKTSKSLSIFLNNGSGVFVKKPDVALGATPRMAALADLNWDGRADLAFLAVGSNQIIMRRGNGSGGFGPAQLVNAGPGPRAIALGNVDRDGYPDLVAGNWGNNTVSVLLNNQSGGFAAPISIPVGGQASDIALCDIDSDGDDDILAINRTNSKVCILRNLLVK